MMAASMAAAADALDETDPAAAAAAEVDAIRAWAVAFCSASACVAAAACVHVLVGRC